MSPENDRSKTDRVNNFVVPGYLSMRIYRSLGARKEIMAVKPNPNFSKTEVLLQEQLNVPGEM